MAKRRFARDFIGVLNSNVFSILCGVLVVILLTRILGVDGFGLYYALLVIPLIVVSFTHLGIRGASIFMIGQKKYTDDEIVSSVLFILIFTGIIGIISSIGAYSLFYEPEYTIILVSLVVIIIPFRLGIIYIGGIFLGKDEIKEANRFEWAINLTNLLFAIILVWYFKTGLLGAIISLTAANILVGFWALYRVSIKFKIRLVYIPAIVKRLLKLGIMFAFTFFVIQLNYRIDILLLEKLSTIHEVGIYSLGIHIAEQLWQIPFAISIVLFSRTANIKDQSLMTESTVSLARLSFVLIFVLSLIAILIAPYLIPLVFGVDFTASVEILQFILPGVIILVIFRVISGQLAGMGKPQLAVYVFLPALIINVILNFFLIPKYGGKGAAIASNISYTLGTLGYWIIYTKVVNISFFEIFKFKKSDVKILYELKSKIINKWNN
ncbi:MAG: polysaccharide biosynthesis C-terminal domain-containing protein [Bacteroidetes bacterium]|nr:polysaccharide biosynthesis C-terminal domain-containing protein [Bacteroidota bacterium]